MKSNEIGQKAYLDASEGLFELFKLMFLCLDLRLEVESLLVLARAAVDPQGVRFGL